MPWNRTTDLTHMARNPWGDDEGPDQNPWSSRGRGQGAPDLEAMVRKGQERLQKFMNGAGGGSGGGRGGSGAAKPPFRGMAIFAAIVGLLLWGATGFYRVSEGELGVVVRFGRWVDSTTPGLRYHLPAPIERVTIEKVDAINQVDSGVRVRSDYLLSGEDSDNLMLTSDENILSLNFSVLWFIKDVKQFLFNDENPRQTIKLAAESAMREVIAQTALAGALTKDKDQIVVKAKKLLQKMLDDYQVGIEVQQVRLQQVNPPNTVINAFRDVQAARADKERLINDAHKYKNSVIPEARGEAEQILQKAEAYRQTVVADAKGQAQRFNAVYGEYKRAPAIMRQRLYLDTVAGVLKNNPKVILDGKMAGPGVLPYLPLEGLKPGTPGNDQKGGTQ